MLRCLPYSGEVIVAMMPARTHRGEVKALIETGHLLAALAAPWRRAGQSAAMRTASLAASSPVIATMDGEGRTNRMTPRLLTRLPRPVGPSCAIGGVRTSARRRAPKRLASRQPMDSRCRVRTVPGHRLRIKVYGEGFLRLPFFTRQCTAIFPALFLATAMKSPTSQSTIAPARLASRKYNN